MRCTDSLAGPERKGKMDEATCGLRIKGPGDIHPYLYLPDGEFR